MGVNPFDIRTVVLAKHAQHVVLIHFPIALFITAVAFDYLAQWTKNRTLAAAAYFNLLPAAISTVPVVATGFAAWQWALEGQKLKGILSMHLVLGCISSGLIWLVCWIHWRVRRHPAGSLPTYRLPIEAVAVLLVGLTGHLGGFLSGVNGPASQLAEKAAVNAKCSMSNVQKPIEIGHWTFSSQAVFFSSLLG